MNPETYETFKQGIDLFWNFRLKEAEDTLGKYAKTDLSCAWGLAEVGFARGVMTEEKADCKQAFERLEAAHKMAKEYAKTPVPSKTADEAAVQTYLSRVILGKVVLAETSLLDAALKFRLQQLVKGVFNFRKSWKYFESAQNFRSKLQPTIPYYNDYVSSLDNGLGFFHFIVGIVPREFMWIVEGVGFEGDRKKGLEELYASVAANGCRTRFALFHLVWIKSFFEEDFVEGERLLTELLTQFPTGAHLQMLGAYVYRKQGKLEQGSKLLRSAYDFSGGELSQMKLYLSYEIGYNYYLELNWVEAINYLNQFLDASPTPAFRVYGSFQLAMSYEMTFHPEKALKLMQALLPWARKGYDYDDYSERHAKRYIKNKGLSMFERKYHIASLHVEACRYEDAIDVLDNIESMVAKDEERALHTFLKGVSSLRLGRKEDARKCFKEIIHNEKAIGKEALHVVPHSLTGMAEIVSSEGQIEEAKKLLKKAKNYTTYDFEQLLGWKIKKNLDKLEKGEPIYNELLAN